MEKNFQRGLFTKNLSVMQSAFKLDYRAMQAIGALLYTIEGREAQLEHLKDSRQILKEKHGIFSNFRGHLTIPIVVKMSLAEDPEQYLQGITDTYKELSSSFILGDESRLLAAMIMYENILPEDVPGVCEHTMEIYKSMRKNHPLLTSQADLPFAVLMAVQEEDMDEQIRDVEECYHLVGKRFHISKDEVQTVSHILAISQVSPEEKSARFLQMYEMFKEDGLKISTSCMPILAVLTNSSLSVEEAIRRTRENDEFLRTQKGFGAFGTGTSVRRLFATSITALDNMQDDMEAFGTLSGTVLSIIIAIEIAIMVMVITASSSASHSSGSN